MVACTTLEPFLAISTARSATAADSVAFDDTWSIEIAISLMDPEAPAISRA